MGKEVTKRFTAKEIGEMAKRCLHNKPHNDTVVAIMLDQAADTERRHEEVMSKFGPNFDWISYEIVNYIKTGKVQKFGDKLYLKIDDGYEFSETEKTIMTLSDEFRRAHEHKHILDVVKNAATNTYEIDLRIEAYLD